MKKQLIQIIRYLKDKDTPTTSASLANALNVSPRSVKSYINEINDLYPASITSSRKGYTLETDIAEKMLEESKSVIPQTSEERVIYIINRLIKAGVMDAYDLCDEMFISYSTLKSDLVKVRKILTEADLELVNQNDTLVISGLEKNKRKLLSNLIYSETQNKFLNNEKLSESFEGIDVRFIKDTILQKFEEYHYFINDYSLENLILHSTITIDRIRNGFTSSEDLNNIVVLKSHEYDLANSIIKELEDHFDITFNENEVIEFAMLILSRASNLNYETITMENVRQYVGEDIYELADRLIKDFSAFFYIDLSQPEFFVRFALHIKNLLVRADSDYFSKNPLTDSIKQNCPLIYDCAVNAARTIKEKTGINLNDDEIAYIAFHLGGALELQSTLTNKITAIIYCPGYYNLNSRLSDAISSKTSDYLVISAIVTEKEELEKANCDLIISTMQPDVKLNVPVIIVSPIITPKDIKNIMIRISEIRSEKKKKDFRIKLSTLITEDLFILQKDPLSKEECIHLMAENLKKHGYVGDSFESEIIERDSVSSVAFENFAIPHAMKMHEKKTGISVMIADEPVQWDDVKAELIMMLCFNINERYLFNELFEPISMILIEPDNMAKVLQARSSEEFVQILSDLLP